MDTVWKAAFQEEMKRRGITYAHLAKTLKMSVPGIKKIFQRGDISLDRFNLLCNALGINAGELIKKSYAGGLKRRMVSPSADEYLASEFAAFKLYWCLAVERMTVKEARARLSLNQPDAFRMLKELDRHGLIKWMENDKVEIADDVPFIFDGRLACVRKWANIQTQAIIREALTGHLEKLVIRQLAVPQGGEQDLLNEMREWADDHTVRYSYPGIKPAQARKMKTMRLMLCLVEGEPEL